MWVKLIIKSFKKKNQSLAFPNDYFLCRRSDVEAILDPAGFKWTENIGDWFLLHLVCKNLNVLLVNDLIRKLHKADEDSKSHFDNGLDNHNLETKC